MLLRQAAVDSATVTLSMTFLLADDLHLIDDAGLGGALLDQELPFGATS